MVFAYLYLSNVCNVKELILLKRKSTKIASSPGFLTSGKDSRTKVVLARKLGKQGLGSTPGLVDGPLAALKFMLAKGLEAASISSVKDGTTLRPPFPLAGFRGL